MKFLIPFLILISSCNKNDDQPIDDILLGEVQYHELIHGSKTPDRVKRQACLKTLIYGYSNYRKDLIRSLIDKDCHADDKEIIAYVMYCAKNKKDFSVLANYYCERLKDPDYHTFDYINPDGHRHGGSIQRVVDGKIKYNFQFSCPMHQIENLGKYSIKPLLANLKDKKLRTRSLSFFTLNEILKVDLNYDPLKPDTTELEKQLKKMKIELK